MQAAAAPLAIGSALVSGYTAVKSAQAQKKAYAYEAAAAEKEARLIDIQSRQKSADALSDLNSNLAAIAAVRASRNLNLDSPTALAVDAAFSRESKEAMSREKLGDLVAASSRRTAANSARLTGRAGMIAGYGKAFGSLLDAAATANSAYGKPKKKGGTE